MIKPKSLPYLVALHSVEGIGSVRLKNLVEFFKDPRLAWEATPSQLKAAGMPREIISRLAETRTTLDPEKYFSEMSQSAIKILTIFDPAYPALLREIYDPPTILYCRGDLSWLNKKSIGIVGTRKVSGYGSSVTEDITTGLVRAGLVVVSGLARGVDSIAHRTTLKEGGKTIAVLGGGLKEIYPPENQKLAEQISENGVVISEFAPNYPHLAGNFPSRNRIIAGLSLGVVVTEAAEDSGSLITARAALEQGREVFAVPGPINSMLSLGPANLIKNGAQLITGYKDILEGLGLELTEKNPDTKSVQMDPKESAIIDYLSLESKHLDEICRELKKPISEISATLIKMEISGLVKNLGSGVYVSEVRK